MIVATFNATTGWAGRNITWQDDRLVLEGHGVITAFDVMGYDGQGHLDWPSEEMRAWAAARYSWELAIATPAAVSMPEAAAAAATATPTAPATPPTPVTPTAETHRPFSPEAAATEAAIADEPVTQAVVADEGAVATESGAEAAAEETGAAAAAEAAAELAAEPSAAGETEAVTESAGAEADPPVADQIHDVLAPGGDIREVVASAPYQEALEAIAGGKPGSTPDAEKWAHLIPEPDNPWDRNAVAVYIDGRKVGYLPRETSAAYAALLSQLWASTRSRAVCRAVISGGRRRVESQVGTVSAVDEEQFGVRLALAVPERFDVAQGLRQLSAEELADGPPRV